MKTQVKLCAFALFFLVRLNGHTAPVQLQNATATFSQTALGGELVSWADDGLLDDDGWGLYPSISNQTAVFETSTNIGFTNGTFLTFTLYHLHSNPGHTLGRFRLSVTTDDRDTFADGLDNGGAVAANWTVLEPYLLSSTNGTTLTKQPDFSVLASGVSPATEVYTISAITTLTNITGVRLEALQDPSLPYYGPGRSLENGNFVLTELQLDASTIPIQASIRVSEVQICWLSQTNKTYGVDYRSALTSNLWTPLFTNLVGNAGTTCTNDRIASDQPRRFYRITSTP